MAWKTLAPLIWAVLELFSTYVQAQVESNCSSIVLPMGAPASSCPSTCVYEPVRNGAPICRPFSVCDVPLNYSLPSPYGCPATQCEVKTRPLEDAEGDVEYCGPRTFESLFEMLYWGKGGNYPFGYLFWNILVAVCVVLYLQFSPRVIARVVTRLVNGLALDTTKEMFHLHSLSVMIIGGRAVFHRLEYLTPNVHIKCMDVSVNVKWWRGSSDIRQSPSTMAATNMTMKGLKLPFRMSVYFTGLEISLFNNTEKYNSVEEYVIRAIYREVFQREPPNAPVSRANSVLEERKKPSLLSRLFCWCFRRCTRQSDENDSETKTAYVYSESAEKDIRMSSDPEKHSQPAALDPLPRLYYLFPITRFHCRNVVVYAGAPTLPTTLIVHIRSALFLHYTEPIGDAPNKGLDSFRFVNKADLRGVVVSSAPNSGYVASDEVDLMRRRMEKKGVDAREVLSEILRNMKTSLNEVKIGMKDVRSDLGQTLGVQQPVDRLQMDDVDKGEELERDRDGGGIDALLMQLGRSFTNRGTKKQVRTEDENDEEFEHDQEQNEHSIDNKVSIGDEFNLPQGSAEEAQSQYMSPASQSQSWWSRLFGSKHHEPENGNGTLLHHQLKRQRGNTYKTVRGLVSRPKRTNVRPVREPDIFKTGKMEIVMQVDCPGRVTQAQLANSLPFPRQCVIVNIGGGDDDEETVIVYGPWMDRHRALFQEHFIPYVYEDIPLYQPKLGQPREAASFDLRINFVRAAEWRLPFREQDIGLLGTGHRAIVCGAGDGGTNEEFGFWFELQNRLKALIEEQRRCDLVEILRSDNAKRAMQRRKADLEAQRRRRGDTESVEVHVLRDMAQDSWLLLAGLSTDLFFDFCDVSEDDSADLVAAFNAVSSYQMALLEYVKAADYSIPEVIESGFWTCEERARWLWGQYSGREHSFIDARLREGRYLDQLETLKQAANALPIPYDLQEYFGLYRNEISGRLLRCCADISDDNARKRLEVIASDPRSRLSRWFRFEEFHTKDSMDEADSFALNYDAYSTMANSAPQGHASSPNMKGSTVDAVVSGPLSYAAKSGTTCGWLDISFHGGTSISITVPWLAISNDVIKTRVNADVKKPHIYASATRSVVAEATSAHFETTISYPLKWNAEQFWYIMAGVQSPVFRMLRTDIQAFADLGKDWASNSLEPASVSMFVPANYDINLNFNNAEFLFNINESNVVDLPEDTIGHNTYISVTVPNVVAKVQTDARQFQPRSSVVSASISWTGNQIFQLPVRATLILPLTHPRRSIPMPLGAGQTGPSPMPDPVFLEVQRFALDLTYEYHSRIFEDACDVMEIDVKFENARWTMYADTISAIARFQQNYLGQHVCHVPQDVFRACAGENFKTLLSYRDWYETGDGGFRSVVGNTFETLTRITISNAVIYFPTVLYPRLTSDGVLSTPEDETLTVFTREFALEIRLKDEDLAEYSCEIAPLRIQFANQAAKMRTDAHFHEPPFARTEIPSTATGQQNSRSDAFTRVWRRGPSQAQKKPGAGIGQVIVNGLRVDYQAHYGRSINDPLAPSVAYRSNCKIAVGSCWGDLETAQLLHIKDAISTLDLMMMRQRSFDVTNGGSLDPCLCPGLPLGHRGAMPSDHSNVIRRSFADPQPLTEDDTSGQRQRKSSLSVLGPQLEDVINGEDDINGSNIFGGANGEDDVSPMESPMLSPPDGLQQGSSLEYSLEQRTVLIRIDVAKAMNLPSHKSTTGSSPVNCYFQIVYAGQGFRSHIIPDNSSPEWNLGYTFLAGSAANGSDVQDLRILVFDGSYGWRREIGEIVFTKDMIMSVLDGNNLERPLVTDGTFLLDATNAHSCYALHTRPPSRTLKNQLDLGHPRQPTKVVAVDPSSSKLAALKLKFSIFAAEGSVLKIASGSSKVEGRRMDHIFRSASALWHQEPAEMKEPLRRGSHLSMTENRGAFESGVIIGDIGPGALVMDPRIWSSRSQSERFLANAAMHISQIHAIRHVASRYARDMITFSSGPVNVCVWSHTGESFLELSLSQTKVRADSQHNERFAWKLSTDGRDDVSLEVKHLKLLSQGSSQGPNQVLWSQVGLIKAALDLRAFKARSNMAEEVKRQDLFIRAHHHPGSRRLRLYEAVYDRDRFEKTSGRSPRASIETHVRENVHGDLSMNRNLTNMVELMPKVPRSEFRRGFKQVHSASAFSDQDEYNSAIDVDIDNAELSDGESYASCSVTSDSMESFVRDPQTAPEGSAHLPPIEPSASKRPDDIFVATRFSSLPMDGPADPYGTSTVNLESFLPVYQTNQYSETNDFWYGSAFGHAMNGTLASSFNSHQTRETGIAPSSFTDVSFLRPPSVTIDFPSTANQWKRDAAPSSRTFQPVRPNASKNAGALADGNDLFESLSVRLHLARQVEVLITPASIAFAEDILHRWFPPAPTVAQMTDYFERNYLVLSPVVLDHNHVLAVTQKKKLLLSCEDGISVAMLHGSKWSSPSLSSSGSVKIDENLAGTHSGNEIVYATRLRVGPTAFAARSTLIPEIGSDSVFTFDTVDCSLMFQVASGYHESSGMQKSSYPVFQLVFNDALVVHKVEDHDHKNHQSRATTASLQGLSLKAGVDSLYVTYSTALTWGDLLTGYLRESAAIWDRQRRQWALLAGQIFLLSKTIDETDPGLADKEPKLGQALLTWCRAEAPSISKKIAGSPSGSAGGMEAAHAKTPQQSPDPSAVDNCIEVPIPGWSTLIRLRRIACFLSENSGIDERMRAVEIDRYPDALPLVDMQTLSGARVLFPEFFQKNEASRIRASSLEVRGTKDSSISRVLVVELLLGLANRVVKKRKNLSSMTVTYECRVEGFEMRLLDAAKKESQPPRRNPLTFPAIAMRPATVLSMLIYVQPTHIVVIQNGKRQVQAKVDMRDRRASDMQWRPSRMPMNIVKTIKISSKGIDCTTSPELVLASRAGASVFAHYQALLRVRHSERNMASELHKKENEAYGFSGTKTGASNRWQADGNHASTATGGSVTSIPGRHNSTSYQTNTVQTDDSTARRTTLEPQGQPLPANRESRFSPKGIDSERSMLEPGTETRSLARTMSFATSHPSTSWNEYSLQNRSELGSLASAAQGALQNTEATGQGQAPHESKPRASVSSKRRVRGSFVNLTGFARPNASSTADISSLGVSSLDASPKGVEVNISFDGLHDVARSGPHSTTHFSRMSELPRTISFGQAKENDTPSNPPVIDQTGESPSVLQPQASSMPSANTAPRTVIERTRIVTLDIKRANFCFSSESISDITKSAMGQNQSALVTCTVDDFGVHWYRTTSNVPADSSMYRDFATFKSRRLAVKVEGNGRCEKKDQPWSVLGQMDNLVLNGVSGVEIGTKSNEYPQHYRIISDARSSTILIPLYAIDNKELQEYVDNWANAFRLASEHADLILQSTSSLYGEDQHTVDKAEDPVASLRADAREKHRPGTHSRGSRFASLGKHGLWPDPFGDVETGVNDDENDGGASDVNHTPAMMPTTMPQVTPDKLASSTSGIIKRQSVHSRVTQQQKSEKVNPFDRTRFLINLRMHAVEIKINPLETVQFTSNLEKVTLSGDRQADNVQDAVVYLGPSTLRLTKQASRFSTALEFTQILPSAWVSAKLMTKQKSLLRAGRSVLRSFASSNMSTYADAKTTPTSKTNDGVEAPWVSSPKASNQSLVLKVSVMVEAVRHSFTPSIVQQFLALQTGLKTELSLLLESVAKLRQTKRDISPAKSTSPVETQFSFFLQGVSVRAKASSYATASSRVWTEFETGGIELKISSKGASLLCNAKVTNLSISLLSMPQTPTDSGDDLPIHHAKLISNIELSNSPDENTDVFGTPQHLSMIVSQTSIVVRPGFVATFARWQERYVKAIDMYRANRTGLEEVDEAAKKLIDNITDAADEKGDAFSSIPRRIITAVARVIIVDTSLTIPFVLESVDLHAGIVTLKRIEFLGRAEAVWEDESSQRSGLHKESENELKRPTSHVARVLRSELGSKRRNSLSVMPTSSPSSGMKPSSHSAILRKRRWIARVEASQLVGSVISHGVAKVLPLRWIDGIIHEGAKCLAELPLLTVSLFAEDSSAGSQVPSKLKCQIQGTAVAPHIKCDRTAALFAVGMWQTYIRPRAEHIKLLRCETDISVWTSQEDDWMPRCQPQRSGSLSDFEDDTVHLVQQESTLFLNEQDIAENEDQAGQSKTAQSTLAELDLDLSFVLGAGTCDFWGDELIRHTGSTSASGNDVRRPGTHRVIGARQRMIAEQRAFDASVGRGPRSTNLNKTSRQSLLGRMSESLDHTTISQRLFVVDLPRFRFGMVAKGHGMNVEEVHSHLHIETKPIQVSPTVVAFFEECLLDVHGVFSEYSSPTPTPAGSHKKMPMSADSMTGVSTNHSDRHMAQSRPLKAEFTMRMSPFELSVKSSQEQLMSSLKLRIDKGLDFVWSQGPDKWGKGLDLGSSLLSIPSVSLVVHELDPVINAGATGVRFAFSSLKGLFPVDQLLYTCLGTVESVTTFFNFWRIEALLSLVHDWQAASNQLLEERQARRAFMDQRRTNRSRPQQTDAAVSKSVSEIVNDPAHQRNVAKFNRFVQYRRSLKANGDLERHGSQVSLMSELWDATLVLFASMRIRTAKFESKLGVLASTVECTVNDISSRLILPGQVKGDFRDLDPDVFYITAGTFVTTAKGLYEGSFVADPNAIFFLGREKTPNRFPIQEWQPWHARRTTLNRVFFRCDQIYSYLARVITGEKARTKTHLILFQATKINVQIRDELDKDDQTLLSDSTVEFEKFKASVSVDAPPILSEAMEQLTEQVCIARQAMESKNAVGGRFSSFATSNAPRHEPRYSILVADNDASTLRALLSVGTIRMRCERFELLIVHDPTNTAWSTTLQFLGARLITKNSADRMVVRDLTLQTGGAEIMRYHGHHWRSNMPVAETMGTLRTKSSQQQSSNDSDSDEDGSHVVQEAMMQNADGSSSSVKSIDEGARLSAAARRANQARRGKKNIASFPKFSIVMVTRQQLKQVESQGAMTGPSVSYRLQPIVVYKFTSTFRDAISVSTDGREYAKLREIIAQLSLRSGTVDRPTPMRDPRQFQPDDHLPFVFEPQLNIMGEATTAVLDWFFDENIQLKKNELPGQVHVTVTDALEELIAVLTYGTARLDDFINTISNSASSKSRKA